MWSGTLPGNNMQKQYIRQRNVIINEYACAPKIKINAIRKDREMGEINTSCPIYSISLTPIQMVHCQIKRELHVKLRKGLF